jgi:hypothetical protein
MDNHERQQNIIAKIRKITTKTYKEIEDEKMIEIALKELAEELCNSGEEIPAELPGIFIPKISALIYACVERKKKQQSKGGSRKKRRSVKRRRTRKSRRR